MKRRDLFKTAGIVLGTSLIPGIALAEENNEINNIQYININRNYTHVRVLSIDTNGMLFFDVLDNNKRYIGFEDRIVLGYRLIDSNETIFSEYICLENIYMGNALIVHNLNKYGEHSYTHYYGTNDKLKDTGKHQNIDRHFNKVDYSQTFAAMEARVTMNRIFKEYNQA